MESRLSCIVGVSCRLPGNITDFQSAWTLFSEGANVFTPPPRTRLSAGFTQDSSVYGGWIGVEGVEYFDPEFFGIPLEEAKTLRPNIRLGLELTYEALENAGIPPSVLAGKNVAVSIGMGTEDGWDLKQWSENGAEAFGSSWAASSDPSGVPGYISRSFNFRGSSHNISSACASGAFALRDGIHAVTLEDAEVAVVGALTTHFTPAPFSWAAATGVLSSSRASAVFSNASDGYVPSEGAVFFIIKTLENAMKDNNPIYGVIRSFATGHNGYTRSLMTPNSSAQIDLLRKALTLAERVPDEISFIEAHGTGTPIGDALEVESLREVFSTREKPVFLSSAKTVTGHFHGAAAFAGVLKTLHCFQHRCIPPHHCSPKPEFLSGKILIPEMHYALEGERITAQINAFGFTGSIASMIIENSSRCTSPSSRAPVQQSSRSLLPFSAKSLPSLQKQIRQVLSWALQVRCSISDLAILLSICRDHHFEHRRAFLVENNDDLTQILKVIDLPHALLAPYSKPEHNAADMLNLESACSSDIAHYLALEGTQAQLAVGNILEVAAQLYERGHTLSFQLLYSQNNINTDMLRDFPLYPFDRQFHWPVPNEESQLHLGTKNETNTFSMEELEKLDQNIFDKIIKHFSAPFDTMFPPKPALSSELVILLTGANGMIGSRLLEKLLQTGSCRVYCALRGNPQERLRSAFQKFNLDASLLTHASSTGSLCLLQTTNICAPQLGLAREDYMNLLEDINVIVHAAWLVNFNAPLREFMPFLQCTRNLVKLSLLAKATTRLNFIGSYASTFNYPSENVPEEPLEPRIDYSLDQGYAISKLLAEDVLVSLQKYHPVFALSLIRVGQICGDSRMGYWPRHEMMPLIITSISNLHAVPHNMPPVSWIPADICSEALCEAVMNTQLSQLQIFHIANPKRVPWNIIAANIFEILGIQDGALLPLKEYIMCIEASQLFVPISNLLPYFQQALKNQSMPLAYASLAVVKSAQSLPSLQSCPALTMPFLNLLVEKILENKPKPLVFLFGSWLAAPGSQEVAKESKAIQEQLLAIAFEIAPDITSELLFKNSPLETQLTTLAHQLAVVHHLKLHGKHPAAVLGYSFGEYAAAITAGILSTDDAVKILVHRAKAVQSIKGAMLNVFAPLNVVRQALLALSSPPSVAIRSGPQHIVLSGSAGEINAAYKIFNDLKLKTILMDPVIPFHSHLLEHSLSMLNLPQVSNNLQKTEIRYISGIFANTIAAESLSSWYWHRHMRSSVNFYGAMIHAYQEYKYHTFVDIGPGNSLFNIIKRYELENITVVPGMEAIIQKTSSVPLNGGPVTHLPKVDNSSSSTLDAMIDLLQEMFDLDRSENLLDHSFHSLGLHSIDFTRLAGYFQAKTAIELPISTFIGDSSIKEVLSKAAEK